VIDLIGQHLITRTNTGGRDVIYCGKVSKMDDQFILLEDAVAILHYREVGITGLATQPNKADYRRKATHPVLIIINNMSDSCFADPSAWEGIGDADG